MTYNTQYVTLPGTKTAHIIGDGQRTACGEPLPYGSTWWTDPQGKVCADCNARVKKDTAAAEDLDAAREEEIEMPFAAPEPAPEPEAEAEAEAPKGKKKG